MYHLAKRGLKVIGVEQFHPPHDLGSSHGETRVIRKAYFEHPNYVPLLHRAWDLWEQLSQLAGQQLIERHDMLVTGLPGSEVIEGARTSSRLHGLALAELTPEETRKRFPMFRIPAEYSVVVESTAGLLWVERCVAAHLQLAMAHGAEFRPGEIVTKISGSPGQLLVQTDKAAYSAASGIVTCGAWTGRLLPDYEKLITVQRKTLFWFPVAATGRFDAGLAPIYFMDLPEGQFYGPPSVDGQTIKIGLHTGGEVITDASAVNRTILPEDELPFSRFVSKRLVGVEPASCRSAVCMYSMSPDGHFLFDRSTELPVVIGAGFSGHGFKFASVLGEVAADLAEQGRTTLDIDFLSVRRFAPQQSEQPSS